MNTFKHFNDLKEGQFLKISGIYRRNQGFLAVEIVLEPDEHSPKVEGQIEWIDASRRCLRILGQDICLDPDVEIRDNDHQPVRFEDLKPGDMVKIKGAYHDQQGFKPKSIKLKKTLEFNIEELQGKVKSIHEREKRVNINDVGILIQDFTIFQGNGEV